jgi:hypothetical protein
MQVKDYIKLYLICFLVGVVFELYRAKRDGRLDALYDMMKEVNR